MKTTITKIGSHFVTFSTGAFVGIGLAILMYWGIDTLFAATFNTYFNNIEQGANSTAHPSLTVDGTQSRKETPKTSENSSPSSENPASASQIVQTSEPLQSISIPADPQRRNAHPFRIGFQGFGIAAVGDDRSNGRNSGGMLTAEYFLLRDFGVGVLGGYGGNNMRLFAGELEFVPFRLGVFGAENATELGLVAGGMTFFEDLTVAHAGVKISFNFGERFALNGGIRTNLTDRHTIPFWMADAGLSVRF